MPFIFNGSTEVLWDYEELLGKAIDIDLLGL